MKKIGITGCMAVVWMAACGQSQSLELRPPFFAASTDVVDFGELALGDQDERTVFLINKGDKALTLQDPVGDTEQGVFSVVPEGYEVAPGSEVVVRVGFAPAAVRQYLTVITVDNDSANEPAFHLTLTGVGVAVDPCLNLLCDEPPAPACLGTQTSRVYDPAGSCEAGSCVYAVYTEACEHGCDQATGLCRPDPCDGVICNAPVSGCFNAVGTCVGGGCVYTPNNLAGCSDGDPCTVSDTCSEGACRGTPKPCNQPPAAICVGENGRRVWSAQGSCVPDGECQYPVQEQVCAFGCAAATGQCNGDPCAGVVCDDPPSVCFQQTGTCEEGACAYEYANGAGCNDGNLCTVTDLCNAGACRGTPKTCTTPTAAVCADATQLRQYNSLGACNSSSGQCEYTSYLVPCAYGCEAGACKNEPTYGADVLQVKLSFPQDQGTLFTWDIRDLDAQITNPLGAKCNFETNQSLENRTQSWGVYGTCQLSGTPEADPNPEYLVHAAPSGATADGIYGIQVYPFSLCSELLCVSGTCVCTDHDTTTATVELRVNNVLRLICTRTFDDEAPSTEVAELATIQRQNGFYLAPVAGTGAGIVCTSY